MTCAQVECVVLEHTGGGNEYRNHNRRGSFKAIAWVAIVWNLMGVAAYINQSIMDLSALPDAQRTFYEAVPAWATAAFAVAVFAGSAGSIALLLRKQWALHLLVLSFIGIVVQVFHSLFIGNGLEVFGTTALIMPLLTLGIGVALIWFALFSRNKSWI